MDRKRKTQINVSKKLFYSAVSEIAQFLREGLLQN